MAKKKSSRSGPARSGQSVKKRVSKADWLGRALEVLRSEGIAGVRVERLARDLGVAKSGFYWHFRDLRDLQQDLLEYWSHEYTEVVTANAELLGKNADERLYETMVLIQEHDLAGYDLAIRAWAANDPVAEAAVRDVYDKRLVFLRSTFSAMGFRGRELEMRTRLFVCYHSWEGTIFGDLPKAERLKLLKLRHRLLTQK